MGSPPLSADGRWRWDGSSWQPVQAGAQAPAGGAPTPARRRRTWPRILLGGGALWLAAVLVTFFTRNPTLVPTVILMGSFLVPVTFVSYAFEHEASRELHVQDILVAFITGGIIGVLGASVLESTLLPHTSAGTYLWVGLIEEASKLVALWFIARSMTDYWIRDGIVLGAAVGFGFAAFESSGYAFNALFQSGGGLSLSSLIQTEVLRGVLAPAGHGLWTAILGAALFRGAREGRLRPTWSLLGWYLVVSLLHAFWDSASGIAFLITLLGTATSSQWSSIQLGTTPNLSGEQVAVFDVLMWGLIVLAAVVGGLLLWTRLRLAAHQLTPVRGHATALGSTTHG
ncbi:MAG: PrsW family intramembrane metalloprotease [Candidatus Dormibacteraeota bacterium]|nr:PrsW family intramembrane metalloprotease [Candidatus Dormibacteraeota bacterium]